MNGSTKISELPLIGNTSNAWILSCIVAVLMGVMSLAGLFLPAWIYTSDELLQAFRTNDAVNLLIGLPVLLGSLWLTRRGVLVGLLLWPGALLYALYNYIAYLLGIPISLMTVVSLAIVLFSAYTIYDLVKNINQETVQTQLAGSVSERLSGWVLVGFGAMFLLRAIGMLATEGTALAGTEIGVLVADVVVSILWVGGGIMLLRRTALGYVSGLGLLLAASMLFVGLILFLLINPLLTTAPFVLMDVVVVFIMGLVCFIPSALFLRGVIQKEK